MPLYRLNFATSVFISHLTGGLLLVVSRDLLTAILVLPGGTGGSTVTIRSQKFKIILTTE